MKTTIIDGVAVPQFTEEPTADLGHLVSVEWANQKLAEYFKSRTCESCIYFSKSGNFCEYLNFEFYNIENHEPKQFSCNSWQEKGQGK